MPRRAQVQVVSLDADKGKPNEKRPQEPPVWLLVVLVATLSLLPRPMLIAAAFVIMAVIFLAMAIMLKTGKGFPTLVLELRDRLYRILTTLAETFDWRNK